MKEERYHLALDKYDKNIVLNALNTLRTRPMRTLWVSSLFSDAFLSWYFLLRVPALPHFVTRAGCLRRKAMRCGCLI